MDNDKRKKKRHQPIYSNKIKAGKRRTYFFDVRQTKGDDYYVTLTESTKRFDDGGYNRHKIFLYKEDFNRFLEGLQDAIDHVKTELIPDYDYDEFTRKHEEYEKEKAEENGSEEDNSSDAESGEIESEEDMSW